MSHKKRTYWWAWYCEVEQTFEEITHPQFDGQRARFGTPELFCYRSTLTANRGCPRGKPHSACGPRKVTVELHP